MPRARLFFLCVSDVGKRYRMCVVKNRVDHVDVVVLSLFFDIFSVGFPELYIRYNIQHTE